MTCYCQLALRALANSSLRSIARGLVIRQYRLGLRFTNQIVWTIFSQGIAESPGNNFELEFADGSLIEENESVWHWLEPYAAEKKATVFRILKASGTYFLDDGNRLGVVTKFEDSTDRVVALGALPRISSSLLQSVATVVSQQATYRTNILSVYGPFTGEETSVVLHFAERADFHMAIATSLRLASS